MGRLVVVLKGDEWAVYADVRNQGPAGYFGAKITEVTGSADQPDLPWLVRWRDYPVQTLARIGSDDTAVLGLLYAETFHWVEFPVPETLEKHARNILSVVGPEDPKSGDVSEPIEIVLQVFRDDPWVSKFWRIKLRTSLTVEGTDHIRRAQIISVDPE